MPQYEVDPLVSIQVDDTINTFYPSRIDNSKILLGCQKNFEVVCVDYEWKYRREEIKIAKEKRRERPYPVLQLSSHPTEIYTAATANTIGNIVLWDIEYEKHIKTCSVIGSHGSMCQGISWNYHNTNLLISCAQNGSIYLWDRRQDDAVKKWELGGGSQGVSYIKFDPFHDSLFCCIHEDTALKLFDMSMSNPITYINNESNASYNTIHYNPYRPNIMAVGCSDRSILLYSTKSRNLLNYYDSGSVSYANSNVTHVSRIETEFEIRDISWNPNNPNILAACGMTDNNAVGIWDIRRPTLPFKSLQQSQRIHEIQWMSHPGSSSNEEYICLLQSGASGSSIDIFNLKSVPLFSSLVCLNSLSFSGYSEVAAVMGSKMREQPHVPEEVKENEIFSFNGDNPILISRICSVPKSCEGFFFQIPVLKYLIHNYVISTSPKIPTISDVCSYNAQVCQNIDLTAIASIWNLLADLLEVQLTETQFVDSTLPKPGSLTPQHHSRGSSISSYLGGSIEARNSRTNSVPSVDPNVEKSGVFRLRVSLSLSGDLSFLKELVAEGDLQNACAMSCVLWAFLKVDLDSLRLVKEWLWSLFDLLHREGLFEEVVLMRRVCADIGVSLNDGFVPEISYQTATSQDEANFHISPRFFASAAQGSKSSAASTQPIDDIPFIVTGAQSNPRESAKNAGGKGRRGAEKKAKSSLNVKMTRSKLGNRGNEVNSFCSVCRTKNCGLVAMCLRCGHGGHLKHIQQWFENGGGKQQGKCAVATCSCHCVFS